MSSSSTSNNKETTTVAKDPVVVATTDAPKKRNMLNDFISLNFVSHKVIYFVLNMYIYAFHAIQNLILRSESWKLSLSMTGFMTTILFGNYIGGKMWGKLADRTGNHKKIIAWTTLAYTICGIFICYPDWVTFSKDGFLSGKTFLGLDIAFLAQITSGWILLFTFNFFLSSAFPLTDRLVIGMLSSNQQATKDSLGTQRLFGAFGHWLVSFVSLELYKYVDCGSKKTKKEKAKFKFLGLFEFIRKVSFSCEETAFGKISIILMQVICSTLFIVCIFFLIPNNLKLVKKTADTTTKTTEDKDFVEEEEVKDNRSPEMILLSNPSFLMFILFVLCSGLTRCITGLYGKLIIKEIIGSKGTDIISSAEGWRCITEVLAYFSSPFIKKSLGIYWVLVMSQGLSVGRMIAYGLVPKGDGKKELVTNLQHIFIMSLECAKGFTSGFISSSAIPIAHNMAPAGCETSAQTLYSGVYSGVSSLVGGLLSWGILAFYPDKIKYTMNLNYYVGIFCGIVSVAMISKFIFVDRVMGFPGYPARKQV